MRRQAANANLSARAAANIIIVWYRTSSGGGGGDCGSDQMPSAVCVCVYVCDRPQYNNGAAMKSAASVAAAIYQSRLV